MLFNTNLHNLSSFYCFLPNKQRAITINQPHTRAAPIPKFPPIPIPGYSPIPIPQIADTFADTDTFG